MITQYFQQVPVIFGEGAITKLGEKVKELGCRKVMCVYDGGVKAAGIGVKAEASLKAAGVEYIVFDKITSDPPSAMIDEAGAIAKSAGIDGLVGVGGGSSLDSAKGIALLQTHAAPIEQHLQLPPKEMKSAIPIILVPTTAGTGSEATQVAVISHAALNAKLSIFVRSTLAIVDPELTYTVPPAVTAYTGLDAFSHAIEAITASRRNDHSELLSLSAVRKINEYLKRTCDDGGDKEARYHLCLASNWAGIAFADTDVHFGHSLADGLSAGFHTPHGLNCAWVTPEIIELVAPVLPREIKLIAEALDIAFSDSDSSVVIGARIAARNRALMKSVGIKSMPEMGFERGKVIACAEAAMESGLRFNCPVELRLESTRVLLGKIYDNYF